MIELPRYKSEKMVHALKIHGIDLDMESGAAVITPEDPGYGPFRVDAKYMETQKPRVGGYYVVYEDGHKSWLPADAFEKGYAKSGKALKSIEEEWLSLMAQVMPSLPATSVQYKDLRKAFYAGAVCVYSSVISLGQLSEDDGCEYLDALADDLCKFKDQAMREAVESESQS